MAEGLPADGSAILVVALSARAIAAAVRRAGYAPLTVDFFADDDTAEIALHAARHPGGWACGFARRKLEATIEAAIEAAGVEPAGLVLGAGFEDRPRTIDRLAARLPLFGCSGTSVAAVKDPEILAAALGELGVPHPRVSRTVPAEGDWLLKRRGGTGGAHVGAASPGPVPRGTYAQERVGGRAVSALVAADGSSGRVLAFSRQWADPEPDRPFRFAGVVGPIDPGVAVAREVAEAASRISSRFGLKGLISLDLLVEDDRWALLEVNPRIGASVDALDTPDGGLFRDHLAVCTGRAASYRRSDATIRATMVVYARTDTSAPHRRWWPEWVVDRPGPGEAIAAGAPVATVVAEGATADEAEGLARERAETIAIAVGESPTWVPN